MHVLHWLIRAYFCKHREALCTILSKSNIQNVFFLKNLIRYWFINAHFIYHAESFYQQTTRKLEHNRNTNVTLLGIKLGIPKL